tara:strand:- start:4509 stop:5444 length:936 start_codon:yes stop_codon:yes gene_type:complete
MGLGQGAGRDHLNPANCVAAFDAYEGVRHRLPAVQRRGACEYLPHLGALSDRFDVFLLDAFGVLNIGETAIAQVPERVARLQAAGKRVMVVSNAASYPQAALIAKYARLGYNFGPGDVISSRMATLAGLQSGPRRRWGLIDAAGQGREDLAALEYFALGDDPADYAKAEGFLLLSSAEWTEVRQDLLQSALAARPRALVIGNPDIVAPRETGFSVEPGCFGHRIADALELAPVFQGKPFAGIFDMALARLGNVAPERVLMVGDSLHTDILGGQAAGIRTALIAGYGFFEGHDVMPFIARSGIEPDFILDRP